MVQEREVRGFPGFPALLGTFAVAAGTIWMLVENGNERDPSGGHCRSSGSECDPLHSCFTEARTLAPGAAAAVEAAGLAATEVTGVTHDSRSAEANANIAGGPRVRFQKV